MEKTKRQQADIHFGQVDAPLPDWRNDPSLVNEDDPDEVLDETPADVVAILGFDPLELFPGEDGGGEEGDDGGEESEQDWGQY